MTARVQRIFEYPMELANPLNGGAIRTMGQQAAYRKLKRSQHLLVEAGLRSCYGLTPPAMPLVVFMTRLVGPGRKKFDRWNLGTVFKATIDATAEWLGVDDNHPELHFELAQERWNFEGLRITYATPERLDTRGVLLVINGETVPIASADLVAGTFTIRRSA